MPITTVPQSANISLIEGTVGISTNTCEYPGIQQCFAVAGYAAGKMLCTHISPGYAESDIDATFEKFKQMGGDNIMYWYIVGPFDKHFNFSGAFWKSPKEIKKTFKKHLSNKKACHMILDASAERSAKRLFPDVPTPMTITGIDVRVKHLGAGLSFSYREMATTNWHDFNLNKFVRF